MGPLPSRTSPSSRCSLSIETLPRWPASYRAKNSARRALSVYRSNKIPNHIQERNGLRLRHTLGRAVLQQRMFTRSSVRRSIGFTLVIVTAAVAVAASQLPALGAGGLLHPA